MTASGHERTKSDDFAMSARPQSADFNRRHRTVRSVPLSDSCSAAKWPLFNHLVGDRQQSRRHSQAERFGGSVSVRLWRGQNHRAFLISAGASGGADQKKLVSMIATG